MRRQQLKTIASAFVVLTLAAFATSSAATADVPSQYPNDEPIDAVPREVVGYESLGVIDFSDPQTTLDGWVARDGVNLSRGEKTLVIESSVQDPYFFSPALDSFLSKDAFSKTSPKTLVKLTVRRENTGVGQIFTAEEANPDYNEGNSARFELAKDSDFHEYVVPLDVKSPILRIRFDIGGDEGLAEIARIELIRVVYKRLKFGTHEIKDGTLTFNLINNEPEPSIVVTERHGADPRKTYPKGTFEVGAKTPIDVYFPQKKPFEEIEIVATPKDGGESINRRFFAFNEQAADDGAGKVGAILKSGAVEARFQQDGSGAEIFRNGVRTAVVAPLVYEEGDGGAILPDKTDFSKADLTSGADAKEDKSTFRSVVVRDGDGNVVNPTRVVPILRSASETEAEFALVQISVEDARKRLDAIAEESAAYNPWAKEGDEQKVALVAGIECGSLKFRMDGELLRFDFNALRDVHAPVVRTLGTMEQAILSGSEYLEKGERSSSTADLETPEHIRYAQPWSWTTAPFASVVSDRGSVSILYDDPTNQIIFAVPDFIDGDANSSRFNLCAKKSSGLIRVAEASELIEEAILWSVKTRGLPEPPTPPFTGEATGRRILAAYEQSALRTPNGWQHATYSSDPPYAFKPFWGSDAIGAIWEITGEFPETPSMEFGGSHLANYAPFLLVGRGDEIVDYFARRTDEMIKGMHPDGSFRYSGKFLKGSRTDYASGDCGVKLYALLDAWRNTGDPKALEAGLKGLEFVNKLKTPAGAQTWELSLHTPDIMGSSRCALANIFAYEGTGEQKYLDAARRWAITGLPFVYLWENPDVAPGEQPMMRYATIAVFGATGWTSPNWMGRPVQWCGLDYAYALILLSKYDDVLPWKKIAEGIVASAECQLGDDVESKGIFIGLLPDSFDLDSQRKNGPYINPAVVWQLRRMLEGKPTNVQIVDCAGHRIASPYPSRVEDGTVRISARKGEKYQVMIDGKEVRDIESQGEDVLTF